MIKAIVVDDEPAVARIIDHFIDYKNLPIEIVGVAEDGEAGMSLIETANPDLVFIDIQMPRANGFEVMAKYPDMRYIVITAYESFDYAQQALRFGASDILLKPIDDLQLVQAIERTVGWNFTDNSTVNRMLEYFNKNYDKEIDISSLAEQFHLTPSHLSRVFKKHTGDTIVSYIHRVRVQRAEELLLENHLSVKEIADSIGYKSLNNFYKHFNEFVGVTPGEYYKSKTKES